MRLLLDVHVSAGRVGAPLAAHGHDVVTAGSEPALATLDDEQLTPGSAR